MNRITKSLRSALILNFILTATLPIMFISFFTLQLLNDKISAQIIEKNHIVAASLAAETQNFLVTANQVMQQTADGVEGFGIENSKLRQQYLASILKNFPYFDSLQLVDEKGTVVMMEPNNPDYAGNNVSGNKYYKNVDDTKQPFWSTTFISPLTGQPTITLVYPLKEGMIIANLNLGSLNQIVAHGNKLADGWAGIIDREGTYIGHTNVDEVNERTNVRQFDYSKHAFQGVGGNYQQLWDGKKYLISVAVVKSIGWSVIVGQNEDTALVSVQTARNVFGVGTIMALILALLVAIWLLGKILEPIVALVKDVQRVATGEYQVVTSTESYEELSVLSQNVGLMAEAISTREKALQENKRELEMSLRKLEISNQELDQFAYVTSHDLKAPLRAIMNLSRWLEEDLGESVDESSKEKLMLLRSRAQRMENLIVGILEYSRIGRVKSKMTVVDTRQLVEEISKELECPSTFQIVIDSLLPTVVANRIQLWQVFANLISNAIKHHHQQAGVIRITGVEEEELYSFSVADNGPGIDIAQHQKVFEIFQTLKPRDQFESTGVGLALVKKIIQSHGGSIIVKSELGQGATFTFTWPKKEIE